MEGVPIGGLPPNAPKIQMYRRLGLKAVFTKTDRREPFAVMTFRQPFDRCFEIVIRPETTGLRPGRTKSSYIQ